MSPTAPDTTTIVETTVEPDTPATDTSATGTSDVAVLYHHLVRITRSLRSGGQGVLSAGVASALWTIINHGPLRLSELADRESVTMPTMSRIVASLEQQVSSSARPTPTTDVRDNSSRPSQAPSTSTTPGRRRPDPRHRDGTP